MSIRKKTLLWLLLPSILIASFVTTFWYLSASKAIKQSIIKELVLTADESKEHIQLFLEAKKGRTIDFSSDGFIRDCTEEITGKESRKEYYANTLNNHLITNKKSLDPGILEIFVADFNGKVVASTNEDHIGKDISNGKCFTEAKFLSAFTGDPHYDNQLNTIVIDFSTVLLSKIGREAIGVIVNRIKFGKEENRRKEDTSFLQDDEWDYSRLITANKVRIMDFSSDGFVKDCTEEITRRDDRVQHYTDSLNTHLVLDKHPLDPDNLSVFVVDLTGRIIGSSEFSLLGKDVSDKDYFSKTMKRGSCISDLHYYPGFEHSTFEVARLLLNKKGQKPIGVIVNRYNGDCLMKVTRSEISDVLGQDRLLEGLGEAGELYIVNSDKLMITESKFVENAILKQVVDTEGVRTAFENSIGMVGAYLNYRGVPVIGVSRYIEEMGWIVLAEKDMSKAFAPIVRLRNFTIIMTCVGIVVIVIIAILLATGITRPIKKLIEGTRRIASGDLEHPIKIDKRNDEIRELGESFNLMMKELSKSTRENKRLFFQVKQSRDEWQRTFDAITDIITIQDMDFRIVTANKAFFEKFNVSKESLSGRKCYQIFHNDHKPPDNCPFLETVKSLKPEYEEFEDPDTDGISLMSTYPLFDERNKMSGIVHQTKDITFQKKLQGQYIDKADKLERANKDLEEFVFIVSHDLNEPLFSIEGLRSRLSRSYRDVLDEKGKLYIERIGVNVKNMSTKISEIMKVLKVGRVEYYFKNNDVKDIVNGVTKMLESKIAENNINIINNDNLPTAILCDKERLKDVFSNLVANAIKYMGDGKQRDVKIGCNKDGKYYKFYVEDTGVGIQAEYQEQVFKMFRRLNDVEVEGAGVGLPIVKKIVEMHNGNIWIESPINDGKGTRFCFTIPILRKVES